MSVKTAGVGHFQIPTAPAAGTSVTSGAANVYTTNAVQLIASTAAALYITGIYAEEAAVSAATYKSAQLMIGAGGAETNLGQYLISPSTGSTVTRTYRPIFPPIPVASGQRISVKTADSVGALATLISLECIAQSNVVDDGITVGTVNLVNTTTSVTNQLTAAAIATGVWQDATAGDFTVASSIGKAVYIANVAPGASGGHMISGSNAGTTTLGALTVTGATTLTGGMTGNITGNLSGSVGSVTGAVGSVTAGVTLAASAVQAIWDALTSALTTVGSIGKLIVDNLNATISSRAPSSTAVSNVDYTAARAAKIDNLDVVLSTRLATSGYTVPPTAAQNRAEMDANSVGLAAIFARTDVATSTRLASASYTAPDNASITAIKAKTDSLTFTVAGKLDVNLLYVNGIAVTGSGTLASPWGPA